MKVVFLTNNYSPELGGTYTVIKSIFDELSKKIDVKVYDKKKNIFTLIKIIKKTDICHFFGGWDIFHLFFISIAFLMKKKVVIHPLGFYEPWSLNQSKLKKKFAWFFYQKKILQKADLVHCASRKEEINLLTINKDCKTAIIPYGISDSFIKKKILRKNIKKKKAIFFSRLHKKKGIEYLIKAWNEINHPEWKLDIVGPKDNNLYYQKLIKLKKFNDKINFLKPIYSNKKKKELFDRYDFFILPSFEENFALAVLESFARGLPVLTNINTPWDDIIAYNAGWYIKDDYFALKKTLNNIFNITESDLHTKKINAIKLAETYNWNTLYKKYLKIYLDLLNKK